MPVIVGSLMFLLWTGDVTRAVVGEEPFQGLLLGALASVPMIGAAQLLPPFAPPLTRLRRALARIVGSISLPSIALVSAASAVGEELLFRAVIQEHFGVVAGVALFAMAHVPVERDLWLWPVTAVLGGAVFGWLYVVTDAALAPMTAHFLVNAVGLWDLTRSGSTGSAT